jgi:hypothetical protein
VKTATAKKSASESEEERQAEWTNDARRYLDDMGVARTSDAGTSPVDYSCGCSFGVYSGRVCERHSRALKRRS